MPHGMQLVPPAALEAMACRQQLAEAQTKAHLEGCSFQPALNAHSLQLAWRERPANRVPSCALLARRWPSEGLGELDRSCFSDIACHSACLRHMLPMLGTCTAGAQCNPHLWEGRACPVLIDKVFLTAKDSPTLQVTGSCKRAPLRLPWSLPRKPCWRLAESFQAASWHASRPSWSSAGLA